jgi:addiction module RelE/StbE family toxin
LFKLLAKNQFLRASSRLLKKTPDLDPKLSSVLKKLKEDPFAPSLKTHKLKGRLQESYACSLTIDLRIIFELTTDTVHLLDIGTHDEVY